MTLYKATYRVETSRLAGWDYRQPGWYFVTICTRQSHPYFGEIRGGKMEFTQAGKIAEREFLGVPSHYRTVSIDSYVVMPNHVHAIIGIDGVHPYSPDQRIEEWRVDLDAISSRLPSLSSIIGGYKSAITRECHAIGLSSFAWQARFYDHLIRGNQAMAAIRNYIQNNPQNWRRGADDEHPDWNALQS